MKKLISSLLCVCLVMSLAACGTEKTSSEKVENQTVKTIDNNFKLDPAEFVKGISAGWNLGNTLDACQIWGDIPDIPTPEEQETGWNNPVTTKKMIDFVAKSGFNAIRIPVTWYLQITEKDGKYTVNSDWMQRVKEVADYCIDNNLYTIVNMHHDDQFWLNLSASDSEWKTIKEEYKQIWEQIADTFKDYNEKLILEGANEITVTQKYDGCGESDTDKCWWGHKQEVFDRQNELYQIFVDTVRNSGGFNEKRYLMLPTYGAQWYENQISHLVIPNNDKHIIMDIHWYQGSVDNASENDQYFKVMKQYCSSLKIGCVIGECGAVKSASDDTKVSWANNFVAVGEKYGISCFLWDDGGDVQILERKEKTLKWNSTNYINAVIKVSKAG